MDKFMKEAIREAEFGIKNGHAPFGAVVVKDGKIIGKGHNQVVSGNDPTCHAEVDAIRNACANVKEFNLKGCEIYATGEPCPMCMGAILYEEFDKIVYAATLEDSNKYYCPEVLVHCEDIAKQVKNRKIKIINIMRDEAVEVLKNAK